MEEIIRPKLNKQKTCTNVCTKKMWALEKRCQTILILSLMNGNVVWVVLVTTAREIRIRLKII